MPSPLRVISISESRKRRAARNLRQIVASVHDVLDLEQQATAERTARVGEGEVFGGEAAGLQQRNGQGVAHDQRRRGGGGGGQVQRAGFLFDPALRLTSAALASVDRGCRSG